MRIVSRQKQDTKVGTFKISSSNCARPEFSRNRSASSNSIFSAAIRKRFCFRATIMEDDFDLTGNSEEATLPKGLSDVPG